MYRALLVSLTLLLALPGAGQAQDTSIPPVSIPSDHWIYPLLDRMAADGLLRGEWLPGRRPVGGDVVATALDTAAARAGREAPVWLETARAARQWVQEEYGVGEGNPFRILPTAGARFGNGPLTDPSAVLGGAEVLYQPLRNVGFWAEPTLELGEEGVAVPMPRMGGSWAPGPFRVTAHYGAQRLGFGASGGIVLHDEAELPWVELALDEPTYLPWLLRYLGPFQISLSGSSFPSDTAGPSVGFFTGEFRIHPFPWFTAELSRSAVLAWEVGGQSITFGDLIASALGTRSGATGNFDDQKASMAYLFRFRVAGVAVNPYAVWAWEDTWEIDEDPGTILGVWLPAVPLADRLVGLRYEYTAFGEGAQLIWPWHDIWQHRKWYRRNISGRMIYVENTGLAHPLGGYGQEHRLEVSLLIPESKLLIRGALHSRNRVAGETFNVNWETPRLEQYSNLYFDSMPGRSWGGSLRVIRASGRLRLTGGVELELAGADWHRASAVLQATWLLP